MATKVTGITITMKMDKITDNTVRFAEQVEGKFAPEKLGTIYVQKFLLEQKGYAGEDITVVLGKTGDIKFMPVEEKKTCILFEETALNDFYARRIGRLYIPKYTLGELGYAGDALYVTVKTGKASK